MERQIGIEFQMWNTFSKWTTKECTGGHFHVCNSIWIFLQYTLIWKPKKKVHSNGRGRRDLALNHTSVNYYTLTRKHSSRMRTVRCSGCRGGGVYPCMHWAGGLCIPACIGQGDVYLSMHWAGRGICLRVSACGVSAQGGVCLTHPKQHPPHPVNRMTDACENITLPQLRCRR